MKRITTTLIIAVTVFSISQTASNTYAQTVTFEKTYGGASSDYGNSMCQTSDGGYVMTGSTMSYGAGLNDVYIIKADNNGNLIWEKTYGGADQDYGQSVCETSDGGFVIAGYTVSYGAGYTDVYLIKTDINGDSLWTRTFGGTARDYGYSVCETSDGGYIITGKTQDLIVANWDVYLIKTDSNGDSVWTRQFGGVQHDVGQSVCESSDGGFVIVGSTTSTYSDLYMAKTDEDGNLLWEKNMGGGKPKAGHSISETSDGGFIIAGYKASYNSQIQYMDDVYLVKTDSLGDTLWTQVYDEGTGGHERGYSVCQTYDNGYIIAGASLYNSPGNYVYLIRTDSLGDSLWTQTFGGDFYDYGRSVCETIDGGYAIGGSTYSFGAGESDVYLIKTDSDGNVEAQPTFCDGFTGLFCDDFEDGPDPAWQQTDGTCNWQVIDGSYQTSLTGDHFSCVQSVGDTSWRNYILEAKVRGNAGVDKIVRFREPDNETRYFVNLRSDWGGLDELLLGKQVADVETFLATALYPSVNGDWYNLRIECIDEHISISVDSTEVIAYDDLEGQISSGGIGLVCFTGGEGICDVSFDNVRVTAVLVECCATRGDIDHSGPDIDISDLVYLVDYMFTGGPVPPCLAEVDVDGSGGPAPIDIADLVYLVDYMFTGGPPPVECP